MGSENLWKPERRWPVQTEAFNNVPDGDPEVKMDLKVCMSSLAKQSCPLLRLFAEMLFLDPPKESCHLAPVLSRKTSECKEKQRVKPQCSKIHHPQRDQESRERNSEARTEKSLP